MSGWFKMPHGWADTPALKDNDQRMVWCWLIEHVTRSECVIDRGGPFKLMPGQFFQSLSYFEKEWSLSRKKVRGLLDRFVKWNLISVDTCPNGSLITIIDEKVCSVYEWQGAQLGHSLKPQKAGVSHQKGHAKGTAQSRRMKALARMKCPPRAHKMAHKIRVYILIILTPL